MNKALVHQDVDLNGLLGGLGPKRVYLCEVILELGLVAAVVELLSAHRALLVRVDKIEAAATTLLILKYLHKPQSILPDLGVCLETWLGHFHDNVGGNIAGEDTDQN